VDVFDNFVSCYKGSINSSTGMPSLRVSNKGVLCILKRLTERQAKINRTSPIYFVGQTVNISKEKKLFAKGFDQNWTFRMTCISCLAPWTIWRTCEAKLSTCSSPTIHSSQDQEEDRIPSK